MMAVTLPDTDVIVTASVVVTALMRCRHDLIYATTDGRMYYRRWYRVHVGHDDAGKAWATPHEDEGIFPDVPWAVRVLRCGWCHQDYCTTGERTWRCHDCDRRRRTTTQRTRRARRRTLPAACSHCQSPIVASRVTRRFCSTRCRVAAHRGRP